MQISKRASSLALFSKGEFSVSHVSCLSQPPVLWCASVTGPASTESTVSSFQKQPSLRPDFKSHLWGWCGSHSSPLSQSQPPWAQRGAGADKVDDFCTRTKSGELPTLMLTVKRVHGCRGIYLRIMGPVHAKQLVWSTWRAPDFSTKGIMWTLHWASPTDNL